MNDFEFLRYEFFAGGQVIIAIALRDFFGEALPGSVLPCGGNVFGAGVFCEVGEIRAATLEIGDGATGVGGRGDGDGTGETRLGAIEHRTGSEDARADEASGIDVFAP